MWKIDRQIRDSKRDLSNSQVKPREEVNGAFRPRAGNFATKTGYIYKSGVDLLNFTTDLYCIHGNSYSIFKLYAILKSEHDNRILRML